MKRPEISVIIPFVDRVDPVDDLLQSYSVALDKPGLSYEMILVVDGGAQHVIDSLQEFQRTTSNVRIFGLAKYFGEATALQVGFDHADGELVMTLPAYHQVDPDELERLLEKLDSLDMVICHRTPRRGSWFERIRRRTFHFLVRSLGGRDFRDLGCGVRIMKRDVAAEMTLYGDLYRFMPILASQQGFVVGEIDVRQSPLDDFRGRYRVREYLHRLLDILTVFFLVRFTKKPLRFFGMLGSIAAGIGGAVVLLTVVQRLFFEMPLADRPALLLGSLLLVLGVQSVALGLVGELIIFTHAGAMKEYRVAEILNDGDVSASERIA